MAAATIVDVAIIGGSFAGLAAALPLAQARASVKLFDTALPRNRFAHEARNILGFDRRNPADLLATTRDQLSHYATVQSIPRAVVRAEALEPGQGFRLTDGTGEQHTARRVLLTYGVKDELEDVPGLQECWGASVIHCPYCHGHAYGGKRLGVVLFTAMHAHMVKLLLNSWSKDVTGIVPSEDALTPEQLEELRGLGVNIVQGKLAELEHDSQALTAVKLQDGTSIPLDALFYAKKIAPTCDLAEQLGCNMKEHPMCKLVDVDPSQRTSVPGVYAAGDIITPLQTVPSASGSGFMAGAMAHQSLVFPAMHGFE